MSAPRFSIILPTIRLNLAIATIRSLIENSYDVDYEIVVVSPFAVGGERIVHVPETTPSGNCRAHALGYQAATGDIIVAMSDDHLALDSWLSDAAALVAERERTAFPFVGGLSQPFKPYFGTVFGLYYPYFPIASRRSLEAIGGYFSPDYRAHFGDPDLALRAWDAGGRCAMLPECWIRENPDSPKTDEAPHKNKSLLHDFTVFVNKHHQKFGDGFKTEFDDINFDYSIEFMRHGTFEARIPPRTFFQRRHDRRPAVSLG